MSVLLANLKCGEQARLLSFGQTELAYRQKLMSLGLTPGTVITIRHRAPLGCPIEISVRTSTLALRIHEASELRWERL